MKIIIKTDGLKLKTNNLKLARVVLFIIEQGNESNIKKAFTAGFVANEAINKIQSKKKQEKEKTSQESQPTRNLLGFLKRKYHHKGKRVRWNDEEIAFLAKHLGVMPKYLVKVPNLARHSHKAIIGMRSKIKFNDPSLSKKVKRILKSM